MSLWLLGGLDPSGGAGLVRDVWAARSFGFTADLSCALTAFTWQGYGRPARLAAVDPSRLRDSLTRLPQPRAIKIGLLPRDAVSVVRAQVEAAAVPVVIDPVMRATDGGEFEVNVEGWREMAGHRVVLTPNRAEASRLGECDRDDPQLLRALVARIPQATVLLKDAPGASNACARDELWHAGALTVYERPRVEGPDPRGTGCALATTIACGLARGEKMAAAVGAAIAWLDRARTITTTGRDGRPHLAPRPDRSGSQDPS